MKTLLAICLLLAVMTPTNAGPTFLNLDPDTTDRKPQDYGFTVTSEDDGNFTVLTIALDSQADAAFRRAGILIVGDLIKEEFPQITISEAIKPRTIEIRVLTRAIPNYALQIESAPIADTDTPTENFGGYNIKLKK